MFSISAQYSLWFLPICLIGGFLYAWFLYRKNEKLKEASRLIKNLMFILRFLSVSIIAFMLLSPIIKNIGRTIEKPIIIYAQDNSESVSNDKNTVQKISSELKKFFQANSNYIFKTYAFGENVTKTDTFNFKDKETDIAQTISELKNKYYNRNIGTIILASDGIYNKGNNPEYEVQSLNLPVYTIALGDTTTKKDLILTDIKYNKTAFLNSKLPLRIKIKADKLEGGKTYLKIFDNNQLVHNQTVIISSKEYYKTFDIKIKTGKVGFHKFKITLSGLPEEINLQNNSKQIIIEVSDKKQKILILSDAPHPDIAAIRNALKLNQNLITDYYQINKFSKSVKSYNLIILNQLPSKYNSAVTVMKQILNSNIPVIYMLGSQSSLKKFDNLNTGLTTGAYSNSPDEVTGKLNKNFNLFEINPEIETVTQNSPPLLSAFGDYKLTGLNQILFYRQIKSINTKLPLIAFLSGNKKTAFITGEGIWRWRIFDYKLNQNHYLFNELINSIVQYMISKENKNRFNIITEKIIPENQKILIKAETYDKNFELTEVKNIKFELTDSTKNKKQFNFKKTGKTYKLNLGKLPVGDYSWKAETVINGKKFKETGIFSVISVNTEAFQTKANHKILFAMSKNTGGKMFLPDDISDLIKTIKQNNNIKPVSYNEKKSKELINFKLIFFIILILLTTEWFMRKYFGAN
ncbi:MAG: hypothetical protein L3J56_12755 [Bacteroidales bacterium]|nr:hypothetical protein [Bacteroidales bacterium]